MEVRGAYAALYGEPVRATLPGYEVRKATDSDEAPCNAVVPVRSTATPARARLPRPSRVARRRVVERFGRITGYTTGVNYFAHSVGETSDDLQALIGAAADFGTPGFLVPLANTELFRWCLSHGLRVFFVLNMLTLGLYQEPQGSYMPSVGY